MALLPAEPTVAAATASGARILMQGKEKTGKTTFAGALGDYAAQQGGKVLHVDLEAGTRMLPNRIYRAELDTWQQIEQLAGELEHGGHGFSIVVIDTIDKAYQLCDHTVGDANKVSAAGLVEFGRGTFDLAGRFMRVLNRLAALPNTGLLLLAHVDIDTDERDRPIVRPRLHKRVRGDVCALCDFLFYVERQGTDRVVHTRESDRYTAGSRVALPPKVPLDPAAIYGAIRDALTPTSNGNTATTNGQKD